MARQDVAKGPQLESRAARLLLNEGAFVRRRVVLEPQFGEKFTLTDLDLVAWDFSSSLAERMTIGECKTTEARNAPSSADRLLWQAGLRRLVGAERSWLVTSKVASDPLRRLAFELGSTISDERDLARREQLLGLGPSDRYGSHDPRLLGIIDEVRATTKPDRELLRAYWFARSELWLSAPATAMKRALGAARVVAEKYSDRLPDRERRALFWLTGELVAGISLAIVRLAGEAYQAPEPVFAARFSERLSEGVADFRALEQVSKAVDEYMTGVLRQAGADPGTIVRSLGAFAPRPPAYAERLTELVQRFAASPRAAVDVPRLIDARYAGYLLGEANSEWAAADHGETARLLRLVSAFLARQIRSPQRLIGPLEEAYKTSVTDTPQTPLVRESDLGAPAVPREGELSGAMDPLFGRTEEPPS